MRALLKSRISRIVVIGGLGLLVTACYPNFPNNGALVAKSGGGSSVRLIWNQASDVDAGDTIAFYALEVNDTVVDTVVAPASNCTMTGLGSGRHYSFSVTAYSNHGSGTEWSGNLTGAFASLGRLSTTFDTPSGSTAPGTFACTNGDADTDGDRLPDWAETGTNQFVNAGNTGTSATNADTDGDGIKDGDEVLGTTAGLELPNLGFKALHKDLAMEFDWFDDPICGTTHSHQPTTGMIAKVSSTYAAAPLTNPDGISGVHLVADYGQGAPFIGGNLVNDADGLINVTTDASGFGGSEFLGIKTANFASNRNGYFHYVLMPHSYNGTNSSGIAELPGDDTIVSLGCSISESNVANTIVHEMGHNLNLRHGGNTNENYKPNYDSVMNYRYQFPGIDTNCDAVGDGVLDYSRGTRPALDENALLEAKGYCNGSGPAINFNGNGVIDASPVAVNLNTQWDGLKTVITDNNDWAQVSFGGLSDADGVAVTPVESVIEAPVSVLEQG